MGVRAGVTAAATGEKEATSLEPRLSVAICTRDRPEQLRRALASLAAQTEAPAEVWVVDNAPTSPATETLVRHEFPGVEYVREEQRGLDFARNRALRAASGEIIAFLDDDAVADARWVARMRQPFTQEPRLALCTGRVEALALATAGQRLFETNGGFARGSDVVRLPLDAGRPLHGRRASLIAWAVSIGSGNSYAVRRSIALELGGFDVALDLGDVLPGGGDHDLLWRVLQAGYEVRYEPAALAWHEHRASEADSARQIVGHQRALVAMLAKSAARARGRTRWSILTFLAWRLVKPGVRLARRLAGRDPLPVPLLVRMWIECWRGFGAYPRARRIASRRAAAAPAPRGTDGRA